MWHTPFCVGVVSHDFNTEKKKVVRNTGFRGGQGGDRCTGTRGRGTASQTPPVLTRKKKRGEDDLYF